MRSMESFDKIRRLLIEKDENPVLHNVRRQNLPTNRKDSHCYRKKHRIIIKNNILYRQYYNDVGHISHLQVIPPVQTENALLNSLHGEAGKLPGICESARNQIKRYFPSIANHVKKWVKEGQDCVQAERIDNSQIASKLKSIPEWASHPEVIMQKDLLPELPPSGGFENIITTIDVISRYAFAYPGASPTAVDTAKVIIDILTRLVFYIYINDN